MYVQASAEIAENSGFITHLKSCQIKEYRVINTTDIECTDDRCLEMLPSRFIQNFEISKRFVFFLKLEI